MVLVLVVGVGSVHAATGRGWETSFSQIGQDSPCVTVPNDATVIPSGSAEGDRGPYVPGLDRSAATVDTAATRICLRHAGLGLQIAASGRDLADQVVMLGGFILVLRAIRAARRHGLFTAGPARRVRELGWFLLGGAVLGPVLASVGRWAVLRDAVRDANLWQSMLQPGISWTLVVVAAGVLTFARILGRAVPLQDEVALTV